MAPGARLGPYEVTANIGQGGMRDVYQAPDTKVDRDVAGTTKTVIPGYNLPVIQLA